jgi:acyl-CoA dehydrogenase family member 9
MSDTDRSFMRALCMGTIDADLVLPFHELDAEEAETLTAVVELVDDMLGERGEDFRKWDELGELPPEFLEELKQTGMFSLIVPEEHGGLGFGPTAYSRTLQQIARHDASVAVTVGAHSSIGMRGVVLFGTDAQKARWLPALATGEMIAAFCLTEPGAGSDAASLKTTAVLDGDEWVLNGAKLWITNGGIAQFFTVFARTGPAEGRGRLSAFVVTSDMAGVSVSGHEDKMGLRASSTTSVYLDNVRVPADHLIGERDRGFKIAMAILNSGRTGLGGGAIGAMKGLIERATKQAKGRHQFGRAISEFGLIQEKLGQMVVETYASEAVVNVVNGLIERGSCEYAVEAAISKIYVSEALWRCADEALQISGGNGYMREYPYERILRDCRINRIFEGTNEVLRLFVALTAMNDVGAQLKDVSSSVKGIFDDPIKGFGVLSDYARRRAAIATGVRSTTFPGLRPELASTGESFVEATRKLATAVDRLLRKHGRGIIGKQFASKRLADIMIDLFVLASVMSRVNTALEHGPAERELEILQVFSRQALRRVEGNFARVDDNEDEAIKSLAVHAVEEEGFAWDNI